MLEDPELFHLHHLKETEDIKFWSSLADKEGGPILELGCGTGRILIPLVESGHDVTGLDLNFPALVYLKKSVNSGLIDRVKVFQSGMDQYHLERCFSLIFLGCNTLSTLSGPMRRRTYKSIYTHLVQGGVFAASFPNPAYLMDLPQQGEIEIEDTFTHPGSGNPIQIFSGWERTGFEVIFRWHYDQLLPEGQVLRNSVETKHMLTSLDEFIAEMKTEKLIPFQVLGDYLYSDYERDSPYAIILARKEA